MSTWSSRCCATEDIDTLVHFAAESHVDRSIAGPDAFVDTNVIGTHALLKAARRVWLEERGGAPHRFHHVSTDEVYGSLGPKRSGVQRDHALCAELALFGEQGRLRSPGARLSPHLRPGDHDQQLLEQLRPVPVSREADSADDHPRARRASRCRCTATGCNVRDWLHVEDHCRAIELILQRGRAGETYNVGGNGERDNRDVVARLCETIDARFASDKSLARRFPKAPAAAGKPTASAIQHVTDRPGHDRRYAIDARKIGA